MGVAQGVDTLLMLAASMRKNPDIGFVFVGRGTEFKRMQSFIRDQGLDNTLLLDEIDPDEIPALYMQCHIGIVALDSQHKTHNIPGKFVSYMLAGLPVLAKINPGNDLVKLIESEGVGKVCSAASPEALRLCAEDLLKVLDHAQTRWSCRALAARLFSPKSAVAQIVSAIHL
jgi:glycosyltransferase involved in cell wall biosynthesis